MKTELLAHHENELKIAREALAGWSRPLGGKVRKELQSLAIDRWNSVIQFHERAVAWLSGIDSLNAPE